MSIQLPLPFPPSALNAPRETLKVKVDTHGYELATIIDQWYTWLNHKDQVVYNRVEFKYMKCYFVIAKLKPEVIEE